MSISNILVASLFYAILVLQGQGTVRVTNRQARESASFFLLYAAHCTSLGLTAFVSAELEMQRRATEDTQCVSIARHIFTIAI